MGDAYRDTPARAITIGGRSIPVVYYPSDGSEIQDSPKLALVVMYPRLGWEGNGGLKKKISEWTRQRGNSPRLYPGSLVWCLKKQGRELRNKVESLLAWRRVKREIEDLFLDLADLIDLLDLASFHHTYQKPSARFREGRVMVW